MNANDDEGWFFTGRPLEPGFETCGGVRFDHKNEALLRARAHNQALGDPMTTIGIPKGATNVAGQRWTKVFVAPGTVTRDGCKVDHANKVEFDL